MTGSLFAEPSQLARRRLRIAQQAFRSADGLATAGVSDADRVAAVVQFDFAVETVLRALLYEARSPKAHVEGFRELLNATRESLKGGDVVDDVPGRAGLQQLRGIRNAAQHEARVPRSVEVVECSVHARDALVEIAHVAWNVDFFAADVDAVKSERVAELVRRAVKAYSGDDTHGAMGWLSSAFHYAFTNGGENLVGSDVDVIEIVVRDQDQWRQSDRPDPFGKGGRAAIALRRLQVLGRLTSFGMNVSEYIYWRNRFFEAPGLNVRDELKPYPPQEVPQWTGEDFDKALSYVIDSVLRMEQVVPDVDPGGFIRGGFDKL